jgi:hypothetical protein
VKQTFIEKCCGARLFWLAAAAAAVFIILGAMGAAMAMMH